jgi:thiamine kinase-like enzyme
MKQLNKQRNLLKVEFTEEVVKELLPEWRDAKNIEIVVLEGGITNKLYRIKCDKGDVAVRIYGERTEMFINRDWEAEAMQKMADEQIAPKLVKYIPEQNVTIVEFITGCYTMKNPDFLKPELHELIVDPIRRIHRSKARLSKLFDPPVEAEKMANILSKDVGATYPEFDIDGTLRKFHKLAEHSAIAKDKYTVSHNDLLAENFLLVQDPYKDRFPRPLYIIDWEYAGMAPRYYDIADMFQEILVPREVEHKIVEHYCDGACPDETIRMIDLYKPYPDIYWALWAWIQQNVSSIKFDFYTYGKVKYDNAEKNLRFIETEYGIRLS